MEYRETQMRDSNKLPLMPVTTVNQVYTEDGKTLKEVLPKADFNMSISEGFIYSKTEDYSTDPMPIGKWINGDTIWREVIAVSPIPGKGVNTKVADRPAGFKKLIKAYSTSIGDTSEGVDESSTNDNMSTYVSTKGVFITNNFTSHCKELYVIIEYTKEG